MRVIYINWLTAVTLIILKIRNTYVLIDNLNNNITERFLNKSSVFPDEIVLIR